MLAIGRKPRDTDRAAARYVFGINGKHVLLVVLRIRVIDRMHGNGVLIVIDRDVNRTPHGKLNADRGATTARKIVNNQLIKEIFLIHMHSPFVWLTF